MFFFVIYWDLKYSVTSVTFLLVSYDCFVDFYVILIYFCRPKPSVLLRLSNWLTAVDSFSQERKLDKRCGTLPYIAPEVLRGPYRAEPADLWSCGVILVALLTGGQSREGRWPLRGHPGGSADGRSVWGGTVTSARSSWWLC